MKFIKSAATSIFGTRIGMKREGLAVFSLII